jgi:hypothetical protein
MPTLFKPKCPLIFLWAFPDLPNCFSVGISVGIFLQAVAGGIGCRDLPTEMPKCLPTICPTVFVGSFPWAFSAGRAISGFVFAASVATGATVTAAIFPRLSPAARSQVAANDPVCRRGSCPTPTPRLGSRRREQRRRPPQWRVRSNTTTRKPELDRASTWALRLGRRSRRRRPQAERAP